MDFFCEHVKVFLCGDEKNCVATLRVADAELQKEAIEYGVYVDRYWQLLSASILHTETDHEIRIISFRKASNREAIIFFNEIQN